MGGCLKARWVSFSLEEDGRALRADNSLLCLPKVHSTLLRLVSPVKTCIQDGGEVLDNCYKDDLDQGDGGDLAHGDVKRHELAEG